MTVRETEQKKSFWSTAISRGSLCSSILRIWGYAGLIQYVDKKGKKEKDNWWLKKIREVADDPGIIRDTLLEQNIIPHPTVMFRKRITETIGLYDPDAFPTEDYDYWLRISEQHDIGLIHDVLCLYRRHKKQLTRTEKMQRIREKTIEAVWRAKERRGIDP